MNEVARKEGRTVLFVSHNMAAIQALCTRAAWLKAGRLEQIGPVEEQVAAYQADSDPNPRKTQGPKELGPGVVLERFEFSPSPVEAGDSLGFTLEVSSRRRCPVEHLCLLFYSSVGFRVAILDLRREEPYYLDPESPLRIDGRIPTFNLVEGDYSVGLFIVAGEVDGDFFDLAEVSVSPPPAVPSVVPYLKCHRGSVELRCTLEAGARAEPCWGG
jgi:lipopolysaccharide transport system ATP-binding protein